MSVNKPSRRFHKDTFEKTTEDRRQKVFEVATSEFAQKGYYATNINEIARKAGISIGAMYSYFASKEDLFLTLVHQGFHLLESVLNEIDTEKGDVLAVFEKMLRAARDYALKYPEANQIYLDLSTQALSAMSSRLSQQMEAATARVYHRVMERARANGLIDPAVDEDVICFCLDNLVVMFQFSFTSDYYRERMKIFLGEEKAADSERIIEHIMLFARKALRI